MDKMLAETYSLHTAAGFAEQGRAQLFTDVNIVRYIADVSTCWHFFFLNVKSMINSYYVSSHSIVHVQFMETHIPSMHS